MGLFGARVAARRLQSLARWWRDDRGATAIYIAIAAIPLIGALGLGTDVARGYLVKSRLHQAVDAAALAGGKDIVSPTRDADIQKFFDANFPPGYMDATVAPLVITANEQNTALTVSASATLPTTFMRVLGFQTITVAAESEARREISGLDVVLAIDVSGSMGSPASKLQGARDAATALVDYLFDGATTSPTVTIGGTSYNLLKIGLVPWNHAVNVTRNGEPFTTVTTQGVAAFTNPITGVSQSTLYFANNSPVPLLNNPLEYGDTTWSGQVYARYIDDGDNGNDGDLVLGAATVGGKAWMGFEAAQDRAVTPRSGTWPSGSGSGDVGDWSGYERQCYAVYWQLGLLDNSTYPTEVPDLPNYTASNPRYNHGQSVSNSLECLSPPAQGITALTPNKSTITNAIQQLTAGGATVIPQGLYWAWEVLMPGGPYDQAYASPPFVRRQAIVLMTDGQNEAYAGDAYKMVYGLGADAGTNTAHGTLSSPAPPGTYNNLNGRLIAMAEAIKQQGVRIYVIKYQYDNPATETLLKQVATGPDAPFYFNADDATELEAAFEEIAADLSSLRLSK